MELDLQRHLAMLREVLSRISAFCDEVDDLRAQVAKGRVPAAVDVSAAATPPAQCDSQQHEGDTVDQTVSKAFHLASVGERGDQEMALAAS